MICSIKSRFEISISLVIEQTTKFLVGKTKNRDVCILGKSQIFDFQKPELTLLKLVTRCPLPRDCVFLIKIFSNVFCEKDSQNRQKRQSTGRSFDNSLKSGNYQNFGSDWLKKAL